MLRLRISVAAGVLLCAAACSPRDFLTRRLASDLIASSDTFEATQEFWLRTGMLSNKDYLSPEYLVLQRRGWITGATAKCPSEISPPPCWDVALTPLGVEAVRNLMPASGTNSQFVSVPVARRQLVGITGISKSGGFADVDFLWKWVPLNEVGAALYAGDVQYRSTVAFRQYDDGWRVIERGGAKTDQGMADALKDAEPVP
jgi:hypothetical protein